MSFKEPKKSIKTGLQYKGHLILFNIVLYYSLANKALGKFWAKLDF